MGEALRGETICPRPIQEGSRIRVFEASSRPAVVWNVMAALRPVQRGELSPVIVARGAVLFEIHQCLSRNRRAAVGASQRFFDDIIGNLWIRAGDLIENPI